jgi:hypothetical protein
VRRGAEVMERLPKYSHTSGLRGCLKVLGEYNSLLHKRSPPPLENTENRVLETHGGGFCLYSRDF